MVKQARKQATERATKSTRKRAKSQSRAARLKELLAERKELEQELIVSGLRTLVTALNDKDIRVVLWLLERHPKSPFRKDAPVDAGGKVKVSFAPLDVEGEEAGDED